jgi:hypothetical protein
LTRLRTPYTGLCDYHVSTYGFLHEDGPRSFDADKARARLEIQDAIVEEIGASIEAMLADAEGLAVAPPLNPTRQPIICSQAAVARIFNRSNDKGLIQALLQTGELEKAERVKDRKWRIWLSDPVLHEAVIAEIRAGNQP